MKVNVIKDKCIGCGNCVALSEGQIFDFNDDGLAETIIEQSNYYQSYQKEGYKPSDKGDHLLPTVDAPQYRHRNRTGRGDGGLYLQPRRDYRYADRLPEAPGAQPDERQRGQAARPGHL